MAVKFQQVSIDAQTALTQFSERFDAALVAANPETLWAQNFGEYLSSDAIKTTYPIPVSAAGYKLRKGDDKLRDLFERSVSIIPEEYYDGVTVKRKIVEAPDFIGWQKEPERIAREANRHPNDLVAAMLEANEVLEFDGKALFAADHPFNIFRTSDGTFDNDDVASGIDVAMLKDQKQKFRAIKAPNKKPMGLRLTDILCHSEDEQDFLDLLEKDRLVEVVRNLAGDENVAAARDDNRHVGTVSLTVCDELTVQGTFYCIDSNGPPAWIAQDDGTPEEVRYDVDSDYYKDTGKIGVKFIRNAAAKALLPHAIRRVVLA